MPPKKSVKAAPVQYDHAETVEELAKELIAEYHPHLASARIAYLFKNREMKSRGRTIVATSEKVSAKNHALCGYNFLITVSYPTWNDLEDAAKRAALDHELEHCWVEDDDKTGETKYKILPHDVEEFGSVIRRHGLYSTDLVRLGSVVEDARVPDDLPRETVIHKLGEPKKTKVKKADKVPVEDNLPEDEDDFDEEAFDKFLGVDDDDDFDAEDEAPPAKVANKPDDGFDILEFEDDDDDDDELEASPPPKKKKKKKKKLKKSKDRLVSVMDTTC